ncbi:MAG: hypothetical protein JWR05_2609, partial [Mucilaginibacter sp.]|nr:hypothetical protein [Mucilaginibacter sp.]
WLQLKSGVMREVYIALNNAGIELAQSQKEIQVMFPEGMIRDEVLANPGEKKSADHEKN